MADLNARITPILSRVQLLVEDVSPRISGIVADASELTRLARGQAQKVDRILTETLERLRLQLIHVDQILTGAMEAVEEAGSKLRQTVWGPVVKATALVRGIQTGLEFFRAVRSGTRTRGPAPASSRTKECSFSSGVSFSLRELPFASSRMHRPAFAPLRVKRLRYLIQPPPRTTSPE